MRRCLPFNSSVIVRNNCFILSTLQSVFIWKFDCECDFLWLSQSLRLIPRPLRQPSSAGRPWKIINLELYRCYPPAFIYWIKRHCNALIPLLTSIIFCYLNPPPPPFFFKILLSFLTSWNLFPVTINPFKSLAAICESFCVFPTLIPRLVLRREHGAFQNVHPLQTSA